METKTKGSPGLWLELFAGRHRFLILILLTTVLTVSTYGIAQATDQRVGFYNEHKKKWCQFRVNLAITPEEHARGLMFRKSLEKNDGLLFIFNTEETRHFWMKNTLIPLDMLFMDSKRKVVHIRRSATPLDQTTISSKFPAQYVLEINGGESEECGIKIGQKAKFFNISR